MCMLSCSFPAADITLSCPLTASGATLSCPLSAAHGTLSSPLSAICATLSCLLSAACGTLSCPLTASGGSVCCPLLCPSGCSHTTPSGGFPQTSTAESCAVMKTVPPFRMCTAKSFAFFQSLITIWFFLAKSSTANFPSLSVAVVMTGIA